MVHWVMSQIGLLKKQELKSVGLTYIHKCWSYVHMPHDFTNCASLAWRLRRRSSMVMFTCGWAWPARWQIRPILGFGWAKFPTVWDCLPWMTLNRRAKFDAASFILDGEIRNHTKKHANSNQYIHTLLIHMWNLSRLSSAVWKLNSLGMRTVYRNNY